MQTGTTNTAPPGCAPTTGSEVPTPRTIAVSLTIESGDWITEKDCTNYALDFAMQLEREAVELAEAVAKLKASAGLSNT